jgi:hypothetical protein
MNSLWPPPRRETGQLGSAPEGINRTVPVAYRLNVKL